MKKFLLFTLLLALCPLLLTAQAPDTLWTRTYGGPGNDIGRSILLTNDGGYIFTGSFVVRTDSLGDTLWTRVYGGFVNSIQHTMDGGYIMGGRTWGLPQSVYLAKTDLNGDTLWEKAIRPGTAQWCGNDVKQTSDDGGYIITGTCGGHYTWGDFLVKTDSLGDTLWVRDWHFPGDGNSVQETSDGNYIIAGEKAPPMETYNVFFLMKIDSSGDTLWTKEYTDSLFHNSGGCILETGDGGFIACGGLEGDLCLLRTDANGDTLWTTRYDHNGNDYENGNFLDRTSDGGYIIIGSTAFDYTTERDAIILKTDSLGNIQWTRVLGDSRSDCYFECVRQTSNNGYIVVGNTNAYGAGGYDIWLLKFEPDVGVQEQPIERILTSTVFRSTLQLPKDKSCKVFDITGREMKPHLLAPGIYFIEIDGKIAQKVIKVR